MEPAYTEAPITPDLTKIKEDEIATRDFGLMWNNQQGRQERKSSNSLVGYDTLRFLARSYPVARACINYRKNQLKKLKWDIVPIEEDGTINEVEAEKVRKLFKRPYGSASAWRKLLDIIVQDVLILDAVSLVPERTLKGDLVALLPVDPATIRLRVVEQTGRTPEPPETAYVQYIKGAEYAKLTTDDLIYDFMNASSETPYGTSLLETLITTINTSLQISLRNYKGLQAGGVPEGILTTPEGWTPNQIAEMQAMWDNYLASPVNSSRSIKFVAHGSQFFATNKLTEAEYAQFDHWLMNITCAVFSVPPEELGFTSTVNRSTAEQQKETAVDLGLKPLASFVEELMNKIICEYMGIEGMEFKFVDIDPRDVELEIKQEAHELAYGIKSIRQAQKERNYEESGMDHVMTHSKVWLVDQLLNPETLVEDEKETVPADPMDEEKEQPDVESTESDQEPTEPETEDIERLRKADLRKWRRRALADIKRGANVTRSFQSPYIEEVMMEEIEDRLALCDGSVAGVDRVFSMYLSDTYELLKRIESLGINIGRDKKD